MEKTIILIGLIYYCIISLTGIFMTISDKHKARKGKWRIPEASLMLVGLLGSALPMYITMKKIHHKTQHKKFMLGLPAEMILHVIVLFGIAFIALQ